MILHDLPRRTVLFRALTPWWARRPTRGARAATKCGQFNREGIEVLYLGSLQPTENKAREAGCSGRSGLNFGLTMRVQVQPFASNR